MNIKDLLIKNKIQAEIHAQDKKGDFESRINDLDKIK
jgi:hypothetical protein